VFGLDADRRERLLGIASSADCDPVTDDRADCERDPEPAEQTDS
jgi:hypothetical protein